MERLFGNPVIAANTMKDEICQMLGFTVNMGVSNNKLLAKMTSDFKKSNLVHTLFPEEIENKMWSLPVRDLFFVGGASERKLNSLGIRTIGQLAKTDVNILKSVLKKHGEVIWDFANGRDVSVVESVPMDNKGYGNSSAISFDVTDAGTARMVLLSLAENLGKRLREDDVRIEVVAVSIRFYDLSCTFYQMVLPSATNIRKEIHDAARQLLDELWDGTAIRHLGIHTSRVSQNSGSRQLSLFDNTDYEKLEKLDHTVDSIRKKYGIDAIQRTEFLKQTKVHHMSGGISREKRTVDYKDEKVI